MYVYIFHYAWYIGFNISYFHVYYNTCIYILRYVCFTCHIILYVHKILYMWFTILYLDYMYFIHVYIDIYIYIY